MHHHGHLTTAVISFSCTMYHLSVSLSLQILKKDEMTFLHQDPTDSEVGSNSVKLE